MAAGSEQVVRLHVERMAYGSDAVAHDATGKAVFVAGGAPGDVVEAAIVSQGASLDRARVVRVVDAGPNRVAPTCPYADRCGGCPWAHLTRSAQLAAKRDAVVGALTRIAGIDAERADALVDTCVEVGPAWGYRNKVELTAARGRGKIVVGMHAPGDTQVVKVDACPLLNADNPKLVRAVSGAVTYLANARELGLTRVALRTSSRTHSLEVALWSVPGAFPRAQAAKVISDATGGRATSIVRVIAKGPTQARRVTGVERLRGAGSWVERVAGERMHVSAPSFFQVNTKGAEQLVELVMAGLSPTASDGAMDLYAGAGTFTLPLARRTGWVCAVEAAGSAVRDLRRNLERVGIDNVEAAGGDAGREFPDTDADIIIVDPPRAGLAENVIDQLSAQSARAIAYVSCDPATLARDLARFRERGTFRPLRVTPVDLFPQTYHVETLTLLEHV